MTPWRSNRPSYPDDCPRPLFFVSWDDRPIFRPKKKLKYYSPLLENYVPTIWLWNFWINHGPLSCIVADETTAFARSNKRCTTHRQEGAGRKRLPSLYWRMRTSVLEKRPIRNELRDQSRCWLVAIYGRWYLEVKSRKIIYYWKEFEWSNVLIRDIYY